MSYKQQKMLDKFIFGTFDLLLSPLLFLPLFILLSSLLYLLNNYWTPALSNRRENLTTPQNPNQTCKTHIQEYQTGVEKTFENIWSDLGEWGIWTWYLQTDRETRSAPFPSDDDDDDV